MLFEEGSLIKIQTSPNLEQLQSYLEGAHVRLPGTKGAGAGSGWDGGGVSLRGLQVPKLSHEVGCMLLAKLKGQGAASAALPGAGVGGIEFLVSEMHV